jgi:hypothetical protein
VTAKSMEGNALYPGGGGGTSKMADLDRHSGSHL